MKGFVDLFISELAENEGERAVKGFSWRGEAAHECPARRS
jgi:hypothetical protein